MSALNDATVMKEQIEEAKNWAIKTAESRPAGRGRRWLCGADMLCILLSALSTAERERDEAKALIAEAVEYLQECVDALKYIERTTYDAVWQSAAYKAEREELERIESLLARARGE